MMSGNCWSKRPSNMSKTSVRIIRLLTALPGKVAVVFYALVAIAVAGGALWLYQQNKGNSISLDSDKAIGITPTQIRSIESIGEWEFLAIDDEEMADTVRRGFFSDDELVRIYFGTLRLGVNLHEAKQGWIWSDGDTVRAVLPPIRLLSHDFIDEARTQSFHESGTWTQADRDALYRKAYHKMKERCMNSSNLRTARENAVRQFENMLRSMGFSHVHVTFEGEEPAP